MEDGDDEKVVLGSLRMFGISKGHIPYLPSIIGNISSSLNEFVGTGVVSTMTRSSQIGTTIQNKLNGKINIISLSLATNFDAIRKTTQCPMSPTTSTVLRDVLEKNICPSKQV
jgi:hypothetical protein